MVVTKVISLSNNNTSLRRCFFTRQERRPLNQKILQKLHLHLMHLPTNDQTMQRLPKINPQQLLHSPSDDTPIDLPQPRHTDTKRLRPIVHPLTQLRLHLQQLLQRRIDTHIPRRQINCPPACHGFKIRFFHFNIQQAQGMHATPPIVLNFRIKTSRTPILFEERYRHGVTKIVQLQSATARGAHDAGVMYNFYLYALVARPNDDVPVRRGANRVPND
mmetsp:Transcript_10053/g.12416  ORF Transcript_10053/g.12416 Transcript_10053/m.12416 type:complete len:218 (-) Transcript_10053:341-994(-)